MILEFKTEFNETAILDLNQFAFILPSGKNKHIALKSNFDDDLRYLTEEYSPEEIQVIKKLVTKALINQIKYLNLSEELSKEIKHINCNTELLPIENKIKELVLPSAHKISTNHNMDNIKLEINRSTSFSSCFSICIYSKSNSYLTEVEVPISTTNESQNILKDLCREYFEIKQKFAS